MPDLGVMVFGAFSVGVGLLGGKFLWALYLAHRAHNTTCPRKHEVLEYAKQVQINVDELTREGISHG